MNSGDRVGKRKALVISLICASSNALLCAWSYDPLPIVAVACALGAMAIAIIQVASSPRPFRWIAWCCFEASLIAISMIDLARFFESYAGV
jgi:hypothetical protein